MHRGGSAWAVSGGVVWCGWMDWALDVEHNFADLTVRSAPMMSRFRLLDTGQCQWSGGVPKCLNNSMSSWYVLYWVEHSVSSSREWQD